MTEPVAEKLPLVVSHADCFDGHTAAWVFRHFNGPAEFFEARYGAPRPTDEQIKGRRVFVLDFSYPRDVMKQIILLSRSTVVLDHHKTAQAALSGILEELQDIGQRQPGDEIVFDTERSGAGIAWDYFSAKACEKTCTECGGYAAHYSGCPLGARPSVARELTGHLNAPAPGSWVVDYVEDRDLWRLKLPHSKAVSAWIAARPMTFNDWDLLAANGMEAASQRGYAVLAYIDQYGAKALAESTVEEIAGHRVPCVNLPYMNCSEYVGRLCELNPDAPFAAGYFRRRDGRWQFSLRSRNGFDVSEVAEDFGGGGHAGAAGFDVPDLGDAFSA